MLELKDKSGVTVRVSLLPGGEGIAHMHVPPTRMPAEYFEVRHLERAGPFADGRTTITFVRQLFRLLGDISNGTPMLWMCGASHARLYIKALSGPSSNLKAEVLAGSMAGDRPIRHVCEGKLYTDDQVIVCRDVCPRDF